MFFIFHDLQKHHRIQSKIIINDKRMKYHSIFLGVGEEYTVFKKIKTVYYIYLESSDCFWFVCVKTVLILLLTGSLKTKILIPFHNYVTF